MLKNRQPNITTKLLTSLFMLAIGLLFACQPAPTPAPDAAIPAAHDRCSRMICFDSCCVVLEKIGSGYLEDALPSRNCQRDVIFSWWWADRPGWPGLVPARIPLRIARESDRCRSAPWRRRAPPFPWRPAVDGPAKSPPRHRSNH
jgi:hypothetical protein